MSILINWMCLCWIILISYTHTTVFSKFILFYFDCLNCFSQIDTFPPSFHLLFDSCLNFSWSAVSSVITMEQKKKVWLNLCERAKLNLKIGKKGLGKKKKTPLKYRRSMSVPDLRVKPSAMLDLQDGPRKPDQDSVFFGNVEGSCYLDETASETSSISLSEQFSVPDMPYSCSPAPSERSVPVDFTVLLETDKRQRATTWYTDDLDAVAGHVYPHTERQMAPERKSPGQRPKDPTDRVAAALSRAGARASDEMSTLTTTIESVSHTPPEEKCPTQPSSPVEMFIAGSAEDMASLTKFCFQVLLLHKYALPFKSLLLSRRVSYRNKRWNTVLLKTLTKLAATCFIRLYSLAIFSFNLNILLFICL